MTNLVDGDAAIVINYLVEDSVIPLANPIELVPRQPFAPWRPRVGGERLQPPNRAHPVLPGQGLKLFRCGRLDRELIACHAGACLSVPAPSPGCAPWHAHG